MIGISPVNRLRWRFVVLSREVKSLFYENDRMRRCGEHVLADLRRFCFADREGIFSTEPLEMARREGRREVFGRLIRLLNLDELAVQQLMEIDDGL